MPSEGLEDDMLGLIPTEEAICGGIDDLVGSQSCHMLGLRRAAGHRDGTLEHLGQLNGKRANTSLLFVTLRDRAC